MNWLKRHTRLLIAAVVAPIAGILALALLVARGLTGFEGLLVFGAPSAYFVELAIGYPAYTLLAANKSIPLSRVVAAGAIGGALAFAVPLVVVTELVSSSGALKGFALGGALGAFGGGAAGATFWLIAFSGRVDASAV